MMGIGIPISHIRMPLPMYRAPSQLAENAQLGAMFHQAVAGART